MKRFLAFFLFSSAALAQTSYVPPAQVLSKKGYELMGQGRYWGSSSRYDTKGKEVPFNGSEAFSYFEGEVSGKYGATKELQLGIGATFRQNRATAEYPSGSGSYVDTSSTGLQNIATQIQYGFAPVGRLYYALEAFFRYTPYTNASWDGTNPKDAMVIGNDGNDYGVGVMMTYAHPNRNFLSARVAYRRPGSSQSTQVDWMTEGALDWTRFALVGGAMGVISVNNDAYSHDPENKPVVNTGGTYLYNSVNPQWIAPYAGLNIALGKTWRIEGRYQQIVSARAYDTGSLMTITLAHRVEAGPDRQIDKAFKEYTLEANVTKVSPKKQFTILDKGLSSGVQTGQHFDCFQDDYTGGSVLIARGVVIKIGADQAVLKLTTRFSTKVEIKEGGVCRATVR